MKFLTQSVVTQLIIGSLIKAFLPGALTIEAFLSWTSFSVIGLFMIIGLHLDSRKLAKDFPLIIKLIIFSSGLSFLIFYIIGRAFGLDSIASLTTATVLIATGTGVTIQTLSYLGLLKTQVGEFIATISALEDIPAAIMMAWLLTSSGRSDIMPTNWMMLIVAGILFLVLIYFRKSTWFRAVLALLFGYMLAKGLESFHVSLVIGGMIAGFLLSFITKSSESEIEMKLQKMLGPLLIFYMVYVGMKLTPGKIVSIKIVLLTLVLITFGVVSKWFTTYKILKNRPDLHPKLVSWGMVPRGIPGFAFASVAVSSGLIAEDLFTVLVIVVSVTTWIGLLGIEISSREIRQLSSQAPHQEFSTSA